MTDDGGTAPGSAGGDTEVWAGDPPDGADGDERGADPARPASEGAAVYRWWDGPDRRPETPREWLRWFRSVEVGPAMLIREVLSSAVFVLGVGLLLFGVSGVWPPMVAVSSGSMEPHMERGDLVFIVEEGRYAGDPAVEETGIVTHRAAAGDGYAKFGERGDVIVYRPDGSDLADPIIHRAHFYVEAGENWYGRANPDHINADSCAELHNCPAPNSGFITKGDNGETNRYYDQAQGMSRPVRPDWVKGKAMVRVPWLGLVRLQFAAVGTGLAGLGRAVALVAGGAVVSSRLVGE